jgi:hypothetical protein
MRVDSRQPARAAADPGLVPLASPRVPLRTAWAVIGLASVLLALAAGWLARDAVTTEPPPPPPPPRAVDLGPVRVAVAGPWAPERFALGGVPGLDERATAVFAPAPGLPAHAIVTLAPIADTTLVPAAIRALLSRPLPAPRKTELLGVAAWRYGSQPLSGDRIAEVTVAPTSAGALAVACVAESTSWVAASGCAEGVKRLSIAGATWLTPAPDLALLAAAEPVVERLDRRRATLRAKLRAATTRRGQSRIAGRLAREYALAAATLAPSAPGTGGGKRLVAALRDASAWHRALAKAAANTWPVRYRRARRGIARRDAHLRRTLAQLR